MKFDFFDIDGPCLITPKTFSDERGFFMETYQSQRFEDAIGKPISFVQDNQSLSNQRGTIRGLHYQSPPFSQGKLVRCVRGSITDVAVDVRKGSTTYGEHIKVVLSAENKKQLWVPEGFLHGFATLENDTEVVYKVTSFYSAQADGAVLWNDPDLAIDWGIKPELAILSNKDQKAPSFKSFNTPFNI